MLQQILETMHIEPELLAELDEEQKQILFCKMREEQVRRWQVQEDELAQKEKGSPPKKSAGRKGHIDFLLGEDGDPWTWVMGEHKNDNSIDQILEEEEQREAERLAEQELMEAQRCEEEEAKQAILEEEGRLERERQHMEEEIRRKAEEAAAYQSLKEAREMKKVLEEEKQMEEVNQKKKISEIKRKHEQRKRSSIIELEQNKVKRSSELFNSFKLERKKLALLAEQQSQELENEWKETETKVKKIDQERRAIARGARVEHRKSLQQTIKLQSQVIGIAMQGLHKVRQKRKDEKENISPQDPDQKKSHKIRPSKPANRAAIADWFKELERPRGSGLDPKTEQVIDWFHGIITRQEAEDLLASKPVGSFIVRVSERIWGYAISYKGENRCKHFLIDTADGSYQFFGTNQIKHKSLTDLVHFHKERPVTNMGSELLKYPCGQTKDPPDYKDLFEDCDAQTSYL